MPTDDLLQLLDELRIIGQNGLRYADSQYDEQRYERLLELTCEYYEQEIGLPSTEIRRRFAAELGHITPKVGAEAGVFNPDGEILLLRRTDNGRWCLPGGWVEPHESPVETAIRETEEETGLAVSPVELVDVYSLPPSPTFGPHGQVGML